MGFGISDSSMYITLYYHEIGQESVEGTVKFVPTTPNLIKLKHDRTGYSTCKILVIN